MDAWCTRSGILLAHFADQISDLARNEMTSGLAAPRFPGPEEAKPGAMLSYDGFRPDDGQRCAPVAPEAGETDPQEAVAGGQFRTFCGGSLKHADLVAQGQVFELQRDTRTQNRRQDGKERRKKNKHQRIMKEGATSAQRFRDFREALAIHRPRALGCLEAMRQLHGNSSSLVRK